ncbi:MAG: LamG domain-containing protein [Sphingobacteriales bacterium]|nr:LamG domain-containing protein [Sphingobacteriales bacterium]
MCFFFSLNRNVEVTNQSLKPTIWRRLLLLGFLFFTLAFSAQAQTSGAALNFDGVDDFILASNDAPYQLNSGTVEAWIRPTSAGGYRGIVVKGLAFGIFLADNVLTAYDWANNVATSGGGSLADGNWHHVAFVFQNGVANGSKLYVDGSVVQTFTHNISNHSEALW